jgi:O-antigen ligase
MIEMLLQQISGRLPGRLKDKLVFDRYLLYRLGVIIGVMLFSAVIVPKALSSQNRIYLVLVTLAPALVGLISLIRWPDIGILLIAVSGLLVPFSIGTGTQSSINLPIILVVMLTGLWIFQMIVMRDSGIAHLSRPFWPAIAIILSTLVSFGFGQFHWYPVPAASTSAQIGGVMIFALSAAAFLLVAYHLQSPSSLRWMVWIFLAISGFYMVGRVISPVGQLVLPFYQRPVADSMFWTWFGVLGYSQVAFNHKLKSGWRIALGLALAFGFYIAFFVQRTWTSGWMPMLAAIGLCTLIARPKYSIVFGFLMVVFIVINRSQVEGMVMVGDNPYSLMTRLEAWRILSQIILVNPIFGLGPANYYWYTALYPILGYFVPFNSHNNYIDILSQTGLIGLGAFLWFCWETGRVIWNLRAIAPEGFERAFIYGCFGGLGGMMVSGMLGDWFFPFVYNVGLEGFRASVLAWLFLGGAVALERMYSSDHAAGLHPAK